MRLDTDMRGAGAVRERRADASAGHPAGDASRGVGVVERELRVPAEQRRRRAVSGDVHDHIEVGALRERLLGAELQDRHGVGEPGQTEFDGRRVHVNR